MKNHLQDHQLESGLVTVHEARLAQRWMEAVTTEQAVSPDIDAWLETACPFSFDYGERNSASFLSQWRRETGAGKTNADAESRRIAWTDPDTGLRVTWELKRFLDFPAVEWLLRFENTGSRNTPIVENVHALDLRLKRIDDGIFQLHGARGSKAAMDDFMPFTALIPYAPTYPERFTCHLGGEWPSSNNHLPFFNIETAQSRGVMVGIGWSGIWRAQAKIEGQSLRASVGQQNLHLSLRPGEAIRSPRILLMFWEGKRLHGQNMFRRLLHRHYVPALPGEERQKPLAVTNVGAARKFATVNLAKCREEDALPLVRPFINLGAEVFIIDAGWYKTDVWAKNMGDWTIDKEKYPRGFLPISKPLAEANVAFGLWFSSEVATPDSTVAREHPEWVRKNLTLFGHNDALKIEIPEAREWFLDRVRHLADHEGMTCFRQDFGGWYGAEEEDRKGYNEAKETEALYALWDAIVREYPKMIMEGCCGGGRRIDLESIGRFHWHWMTDRLLEMENDQCSAYGACLFLPGGVLSMYTECPDDYSAWTSFSGQPILCWQPLEKDFPMERAKRQVELFKRIRHLLRGDFYPLTPYGLSTPWLGYQFHRDDLDQGIALAFHRPFNRDEGGPEEDTLVCRLRGLDPAKRYWVRSERNGKEEIRTGAELAEGLAVTIPERRGAEMLIYRAKNKGAT
ncbi:MAG: alpha-galactosidase [Kiritimatiellae bacterium]|nr:alpha-galactosidase [Kiritimatiellia bacterium]